NKITDFAKSGAAPGLVPLAEEQAIQIPGSKIASHQPSSAVTQIFIEHDTFSSPFAPAGLGHHLVEDVRLVFSFKRSERSCVIKQKQRDREIVLLGKYRHLPHRFSKPDTGPM